MRPTIGCSLGLAALVVVGPARALSSWWQVTPANLGKQQLVITISVTRVPHRHTFRVSVRPRPGAPYRFVMDSASAWFEDAGEGRNHISLPDVAATPLMIASHGRQGADFRFSVPDREPTRRRFAFGYEGYDTGQKIMLSGDFYWFSLSAFKPLAAARKGPYGSRPPRSHFRKRSA